MIVVAVASGTSLDAVDQAAVELDWAEDGALELRVLGTGEHPWPAGLGERLLALLAPTAGTATTTAAEVCALDTEVGQAFAAAADDAVHALAGGLAELVVSPGQTVHHEVAAVAGRSRCHGTLQLGQPAWVAEATGLPVVSDLRARDVAAGGHGAPLATTLDACWLGALVAEDGRARAALNLGGVANVTVVAPGAVRGWDTGPGCCLLDLAARRVSGHRYDVDGALAGAGRVRPDLLARLLDTDYLRLQPPKSTGRETFSAALLDAALHGLDPVDGTDLLATLTELTAATVAADLRDRVEEVVVSGGGARNPALRAALDRLLAPVPVVGSAAYGLDPDAKEAVLWALLGFCTWHGLPGTVAGVTGAEGPRVLGRISPGRGPLVLPEPRPREGDLRLRTVGRPAEPAYGAAR